MNQLKKNVSDELKKLWTGEIASVVAFGAFLFMLKSLLSNMQNFLTVAYSLAVLCFILIQGAVYWWILLKRLSTPQFGRKHTGQIYHILEILDIILIVIGIPLIIFNASGFGVIIIALFFEIFSFVEWVNYFKIRLSYSYNPMVLLRHIKNKTLKRSKLAREIHPKN